MKSIALAALLFAAFGVEAAQTIKVSGMTFIDGPVMQAGQVDTGKVRIVITSGVTEIARGIVTQGDTPSFGPFDLAIGTYSVALAKLLADGVTTAQVDVVKTFTITAPVKLLIIKDFVIQIIQ